MGGHPRRMLHWHRFGRRRRELCAADRICVRCPAGWAGVGIWKVENTIRGPKSDGDEGMMV